MPNHLEMSEHPQSALRWLLLSLLILIVDQLSKNYIVTTFSLNEVREVLTGLNLTLAYNQGAAFSFMSDAGGWQRWVFLLIGCFVVSWLVLWLSRPDWRSQWTPCSIALIIGGALGNMWDRLLLGYVVDFIDIYYKGWHWPAFNVADATVCMGVCILCFSTLFEQKKEEWM